MSDRENEMPIFAHENCNIIYSIQNDDEANECSSILPMTNSRTTMRIHDKVFITILLLILLIGFTIGVHLLITEGHEWRTTKVYNLTSRELWRAHLPSSTMPKLKLPAKRVLFFQTNSSSCDRKSQCAKLVLGLQLRHMLEWKEADIPYNFIVTGEGSIFEGRGWKFQTTFLDYSASNVVTLAFMGKFDTNPPTLEQAESAKLFLDVAVMEGKLERCYNIMVWGQNRFFIELALSIETAMSDCQETN